MSHLDTLWPSQGAQNTNRQEPWTERSRDVASAAAMLAQICPHETEAHSYICNLVCRPKDRRTTLQLTHTEYIVHARPYTKAFMVWIQIPGTSVSGSSYSRFTNREMSVQ